MVFGCGMRATDFDLDTLDREVGATDLTLGLCFE